jgi:FkbM family methyltransferase
VQLRALAYYAKSIGTLIGGIRNWRALVWDLAGFPISRPYVIRLRDGAKFRIRSLMDAWIVKEVYLDRDYERWGAVLQAGWTVVDVGAHIGAFSVLAARQAPRIQVHAFEPTPDSYILLCQNVELNRAMNVTTHALAVRRVTAPLPLYTLAGNPERNSIIAPGPRGQCAAMTVTALTLADVFERFAIERCDFLKLDCEGAEFDLLLQAPPELFRRIRHVCLEYHDGATAFSHADLLRLFTRLGLRTRHAPSPVQPGQGFLHALNLDLQ